MTEAKTAIMRNGFKRLSYSNPHHIAMDTRWDTPTQLAHRRASNSSTVTVRSQVIEFADATRVDHAEILWGSAQTSQTYQPPLDFDASGSAVMGAPQQNMYGSNYGQNNSAYRAAYGNGSWTPILPSDYESAVVDRSTTGNFQAEVSADIIEWPTGAPPPPTFEAAWSLPNLSAG